MKGSKIMKLNVDWNALICRTTSRPPFSFSSPRRICWATQSKAMKKALPRLQRTDRKPSSIVPAEDMSERNRRWISNTCLGRAAASGQRDADHHQHDAEIVVDVVFLRRKDLADDDDEYDGGALDDGEDRCGKRRQPDLKAIRSECRGLVERRLPCQGQY